MLVVVAEVDDDPAAESLLNAELDLIALAGRQWRRLSDERFGAHTARQEKVLVVRRLERTPVRCAQHGAAPRHSEGSADARLNERGRGQTIVVIEPNADLEVCSTSLDVVLNIRGLLLDRRCLREAERRTPPRQIKGQQIRVEVWIHGQPASALAGRSERSVLGWIAAGVETGRIERRIG